MGERSGWWDGKGESGMKWEDPESGMRREQDNGMHSEKGREDRKNSAFKRIEAAAELEWEWLDSLILQVRDKDTLLGGFELTD